MTIKKKTIRTIIILTIVMVAVFVLAGFFFFNSGFFDFQTGSVTPENAKSLLVELDNFINSKFGERVGDIGLI